VIVINSLWSGTLSKSWNIPPSRPH
jgi:hypothetical protein